MSISSLADTTAAAIRNSLANEVFGSAALAIGSTATNITNAAISYKINGQVYTKAASAAAGANVALTTVQAAGTTCYYILYVNAAGTVAAVKGTDGSVLLPITSVPDLNAVIGVLRVASGGATFQLGTTALTGLVAWANVSQLPSAIATDLTYA